jgi:hypothetical protein
MNCTVTIHSYHGPQTAAQLDAILPVYEQVYAEPPYYEGPRRWPNSSTTSTSRPAAPASA